ncbi:acetoacetate--CoA ligase [Jongsikchunia kroppenstedtii]|uniref:acetoacetate--CoA ligase n=1 Tax=Jongsikchunia kroppenstedtii TaxID=1121721 RepID=UPI00035E5190|nr:acetoacetate--CoA ligase [Jongsikchunia kroppenstedtii]
MSQIDRLADQVGHSRNYGELWQWSVDRPAEFWRALWEFYDLRALGGTAVGPDDADIVDDVPMPGTGWFRGAAVNYVDQVLRHVDERPDAVAVVSISEDGGRRTLTWAQLRDQVASLSEVLRERGVRQGDTVAAYLPDIGEAVVAFLASAAIGAIWSGCGQDYAPEGAAGRFAQLEPTVLFCADGYRYGGKDIDKRADSAALASLLPSLSTVVSIGAPVGVSGELDFADCVGRDSAQLRYDPVDFAHPLWVLFSSGTTGKPKGIVHGHGGVIVEHLKQAGLHADIGPDDVFFWQTALSWMMWNYQLAGLLVGAQIVCYSGHPLYPDADRLWQILESERVTFFGTSPGQLQASRKAGLRPGVDHDLSALRTLGSTGSTLAADLFGWVDDNVRQGIPVSSVSGGTDVVSAFAGGSPGVPVVAGELSCRYLGVALESWSPEGDPLVDEVGEMVITTPMPSMPVKFWNDPNGKRYRSAYFDHEWVDGPRPHIWRHGDWVTVTDRGSLIIHGRSDATLNRNGIRMGSADIYEVVEGIEQIAEAFVLGVDGPDGAYWMPLFVTLVPGADLDDDLVARIRHDVRTKLSPRHVPDEVVAAPGIPHTRTGKKLEVPVTAMLAGRSDVAIDPRAVDDVDLLDWYREQGVRHRW